MCYLSLGGLQITCYYYRFGIVTFLKFCIVVLGSEPMTPVDVAVIQLKPVFHFFHFISIAF